MTRRRHLCQTFRVLLAGTVAMLTLLMPATAQTPPGLDRAIEGLRSFRYGPDRSALDAVAAAVKQSLASPQQRAAAARALADVATSNASEEARQFACRQLVMTASAEQVPAMLKLLGEESMAHYGLVVLARIPDKSVEAGLRRSLSTLKGKALLGAIDLLGERRDAAAARAIAGYARSADNVLASCAMNALAHIGSQEADGYLMAEFGRATPARKSLFGDAMLVRADAARSAGDRALAGRLYAAVDIAGMPETTRAAAFRGKLLLQGDAAAPALIAALRGPDGRRRNMAAMLARTLGGATVTRRLAAALPSLSPDACVLLLDALADRRDPAALAGVAALLKSGDDRVRSRAIAAMGALGGPEAVRPLLDIAAGVNAAHRELAATALANLRGKGVDAALVRALDVPAAGVQAAAIRALTARRGAVSLDRLLAIAQSGPKPAAAAALEALRQMGRPSDLKPLLDLMMARPADDREPVAAAWLDIARRSAGDTAGALAEERLKTATKREDRVVLLGLLGQLGGDRALAALTAAAKDADPEVRLTAVRALAEWPDARPMALLLETVKENPSARLRAVAMRGYLRCLGLPGGPDAARASELYVEALGLATTPDEKRLVLSGMATVGSPGLLDMAVSLTADPDLRSEAEQAAYSICHLTAGAWPDETRQALQKLAADAADPDLHTKARALLDTMARFGDFVMAWEVSPAYAQEGTDFSKLFDIPFPPEDPAQEPTAGWRVMPVGMSAEQPWLLDLLAVHGGEQKVAYLRTAVWSEADRDIIAEIGTDDGLKVWWNGTLVCSNNTQRAVAPAQEKVAVHARTGWNRMLIKVTQNIMGWGACVRFVAPDGSPARGLRVTLPSFAPENERGGATSTASGK